MTAVMSSAQNVHLADISPFCSYKSDFCAMIISPSVLLQRFFSLGHNSRAAFTPYPQRLSKKGG
jgi:hypothetical protein